MAIGRKQDPNTKIFEYIGRHTIRNKHIFTLVQNTWLSSEIIDFYFDWLVENRLSESQKEEIITLAPGFVGLLALAQTKQMFLQQIQ